MKKSIALFFVYAAIVLACLVVMDICVGFLFRKVVNKLDEKVHDSQSALASYNVNTLVSDIVVIGSSTATCHFAPAILADSINMYLGTDWTAFNGGTRYQQPSYSYCMMKCLVDRTAPNIAIVDIQPQQLSGKANYTALKCLHPFYGMNDNVKEILDDNETFWERIWLKSSMFQFNSQFINLFSAFLRGSNADGFDPKNGTMSESEYAKLMKPDDEDDEREEEVLNQVLVREFDSMMRIANDNDVRLFIVMSPRLYKVDRNSLSYRKIVELCKKHDVPLLDFSDDEQLCRRELFYDGIHMNEEGALLLTRKTCECIRGCLWIEGTAEGTAGTDPAVLSI